MQPVSMRITLNGEEHSALMRLAAKELRKPQQQARMLIRQGLQASTNSEETGHSLAAEPVSSSPS